MSRIKQLVYLSWYTKMNLLHSALMFENLDNLANFTLTSHKMIRVNYNLFDKHSSFTICVCV